MARTIVLKIFHDNAIASLNICKEDYAGVWRNGQIYLKAALGLAIGSLPRRESVGSRSFHVARHNSVLTRQGQLPVVYCVGMCAVLWLIFTSPRQQARDENVRAQLTGPACSGARASLHCTCLPSSVKTSLRAMMRVCDDFYISVGIVVHVSQT